MGQCFKGNNILTLCVVHINNYIAKTAGDWFVYNYRYCIVVLYTDAIQLNFPSSVVLYNGVFKRRSSPLPAVGRVKHTIVIVGDAQFPLASNAGMSVVLCRGLLKISYSSTSF